MNNRCYLSAWSCLHNDSTGTATWAARAHVFILNITISAFVLSRLTSSVISYTLASLYSMRTVRRGRCPLKGLELASEAPPRLRSASSSRGYNWVRLAAPLLAEAGASPGAST
ncbi:hypothetical protein ACLKA7_010471 [Drosophila subpalustris]